VQGDVCVRPCVLYKVECDGILLLAARHILLHLHIGDFKMAYQCVCGNFCMVDEEKTLTRKNRLNRKREKVKQWNFMTCNCYFKAIR
jgi:hypothetical protein